MAFQILWELKQESQRPLLVADSVPGFMSCGPFTTFNDLVNKEKYLNVIWVNQPFKISDSIAFLYHCWTRIMNSSAAFIRNTFIRSFCGACITQAAVTKNINDAVPLGPTSNKCIPCCLYLIYVLLEMVKTTRKTTKQMEWSKYYKRAVVVLFGPWLWANMYLLKMPQHNDDQFCPQRIIFVVSRVWDITRVRGRIQQRLRTNHNPFLVLITMDNYRGELWTKLLPHRLQSPVFRETPHLSHPFVSLSLSLSIFSLSVFSLSLHLFILLCHLPPE